MAFAIISAVNLADDVPQFQVEGSYTSLQLERLGTAIATFARSTEPTDLDNFLIPHGMNVDIQSVNNATSFAARVIPGAEYIDPKYPGIIASCVAHAHTPTDAKNRLARTLSGNVLVTYNNHGRDRREIPLPIFQIHEAAPPAPPTHQSFYSIGPRQLLNYDLDDCIAEYVKRFDHPNHSQEWDYLGLPDEGLPHTVQVDCYEHQRVHANWNPLFHLIESIDEQFGPPDHASEPTPSMMAAERSFVSKVVTEYNQTMTWACRPVGAIHVDLQDWFNQHQQ